MKYILALDQGTTSSRAIVFDKKGNIKGIAQQEFPQIYPKNGWVEHDPMDILGSQVGVIGEALIRANISAKDIEAIGITNQRETTIVWDRATGKPIYNAIVWQCRRTADYCEELKKQGYQELVYEKTGLIIDSYFSATKIKWILDNVPEAREKAEKGELCFGTVDTYVMWALSEKQIFATDYTNASRTMLLISILWNGMKSCPISLEFRGRCFQKFIHRDIFSVMPPKRLSEHAYRFAGLPVTNRQLYSDNFVPKKERLKILMELVVLCL